MAYCIHTSSDRKIADFKICIEMLQCESGVIACIPLNIRNTEARFLEECSFG